MNTIKKTLVRSLLEIGLMAIIFVPSWLIVEKLMGYPQHVGVLVGSLLAFTLATLLRGLRAAEFGEAEGMVAVALLVIVWGRQSVLSPNAKLAWTVALIAIPLTTYAIGRVINKRRNVGQSVA